MSLTPRPAPTPGCKQAAAGLQDRGSGQRHTGSGFTARLPAPRSRADHYRSVPVGWIVEFRGFPRYNGTMTLVSDLHARWLQHRRLLIDDSFVKTAFDFILIGHADLHVVKITKHCGFVDFAALTERADYSVERLAIAFLGSFMSCLNDSTVEITFVVFTIGCRTATSHLQPAQPPLQCQAGNKPGPVLELARLLRPQARHRHRRHRRAQSLSPLTTRDRSCASCGLFSPPGKVVTRSPPS